MLITNIIYTLYHFIFIKTLWSHYLHFTLKMEGPQRLNNLVCIMRQKQIRTNFSDSKSCAIMLHIYWYIITIFIAAVLPKISKPKYTYVIKSTLCLYIFTHLMSVGHLRGKNLVLTKPQKLSPYSYKSFDN